MRKQPNDEGPTGPVRPLLSHPPTLGACRPVVPGLHRTLGLESVPEPEADREIVARARRETQPEHQKRELVRTEALVDVMKELASEVRSVCRDVDRIKAIITKVRRLADAKRRGMASLTTMRTDSLGRITFPARRREAMPPPMEAG